MATATFATAIASHAMIATTMPPAPGAVPGATAVIGMPSALEPSVNGVIAPQRTGAGPGRSRRRSSSRFSIRSTIASTIYGSYSAPSSRRASSATSMSLRSTTVVPR